MIEPVARQMRFALAALLCFTAVPARAELVSDLHQAQVPVSDRSQQELDRAAREALGEVLVKLSGSENVLALPPLEAALGDARKRAQQYSFVRDPRSPGALAAQFQFDARSTNRLLTEAGAPLWTANRPTVLVWLVLESPEGRQFVNPESAPELSAALVTEFARRGVPLRLPLYDLSDAAAISVDQAWRLSEAALQHASHRYRVGEVLAGRVTIDGEPGLEQDADDVAWRGDWLHLSAADNDLPTDVEQARTAQANGSRAGDPRTVEVASAEAFAGAGVAMVAEDLAARYAVAASAGAAGGVVMVVSGVDSYADYAGVVSWLESLELVEHANVEQVRGDRLRLRLVAQADATQLATLIGLSKRLVPVPSLDPGTSLSYQWQN